MKQIAIFGFALLAFLATISSAAAQDSQAGALSKGQIAATRLGDANLDRMMGVDHYPGAVLPSTDFFTGNGSGFGPQNQNGLPPLDPTLDTTGTPRTATQQNTCLTGC